MPFGLNDSILTCVVFVLMGVINGPRIVNFGYKVLKYY